ncbi:hypothetical protein HOY82DRAFT_535245 [Tuber indicum]|nr:hypothetical protein HOY82DRAFT_535245 [Tuber indicum]
MDVISYRRAGFRVSLDRVLREGSTSKWEQRSFNMLSILFTAIASLGLGSLLGHLGSVIRWSQLAWAVYQMQDSILGMPPRAGSFRLIKRHIREWGISRTTFIVTAYLVTNVIGRLSVAIFGLAYNMGIKTGIEYPILATNWKSDLWIGRISSNWTRCDRGDVSEVGEGKETAEELAASLDDALKTLVSYGTRKRQNGGPPEVDLTSGLDADFPPFPLKRRLWRNAG